MSSFVRRFKCTFRVAYGADKLVQRQELLSTTVTGVKASGFARNIRVNPRET